jgi:hypothetical protein
MMFSDLPSPAEAPSRMMSEAKASRRRETRRPLFGNEL